MSLKTLSIICKRAGFNWKRIKKKLKQKKNETDYQKSVEMIAQLIDREEQGEIDLFYFDESGFYRKPGVKYAWQEKGKQIFVSCSKQKNLNVLGFLNQL